MEERDKSTISYYRWIGFAFNGGNVLLGNDGTELSSAVLSHNFSEIWFAHLHPIGIVHITQILDTDRALNVG